MERRNLHAPVVDQVRILFVQPSVLKGLPIKICAGIRCCYRHLESVRIDFTGKPDRLLDRLLRLTGQAENKGAVDDYAELVAVVLNCRATSIRTPFLMLCRICWLPDS